MGNAYLNTTQIGEVLDARIVPPVDGLIVEAFATSATDSLLAIYVPKQPAEMQPYLVHGAIAEGKVEGAFFSRFAGAARDPSLRQPSKSMRTSSPGNATSVEKPNSHKLYWMATGNGECWGSVRTSSNVSTNRRPRARRASPWGGTTRGSSARWISARG